MFKKISYILLGMTLMVSGTVLAAPYFTYQRTLLPETNNAFDLGTTTSVWRDLFVTQICLSGDCKTAWPTGGSGGAFAWTSNSWGNSTTSTIGFLTGGLFTNASSTFGANTYFSSLSQGFAFIGSAGKLSSIASSSVNLSWFNNDSGFLTSVAPTDLNSADFGDFTCNGTSCTLDTTYLTSYTSPYEIATGTIAVSDLAFFGKTSGRTTLEGVATTTLTASSPLSLSNPVVKVGGSNSVLTLDTSGSWTGSAGSVANALTAGNGLTSAGTYNGAIARTFSINSTGLSTNALVTWDGTNFVATGTPRLTIGSLISTTTATSTFAGGIDTGIGNHIKVHGIESDASDGLHIHAGNGTNVGLFGAGNTANALFYGGVNVTGAFNVLGTSLASWPYSSSTAYSSFVTASSTQWIGGGLQACDATTGKLNWDSTTKQFKCDTDQTGGGGFTGAINSIVTTDGSGNLMATGTQLTVGNIIATTSATSIFSGNIVAAGDGVQYLGGPSSSNRFYVTAYGITDGNTTQSPGQFKWQSGTGGTNIQSGAFNMGSAIVFGWSGGDVNAVAKDTALSRLSAGRIAVGNGSGSDTSGGLSMAYSSTTYGSFTTASSTFGNIGTLTLSTTTAGCLNTGSTGIVYASTCASGLSSYDAWTPHWAAGFSATTSSIAVGTTTSYIASLTVASSTKPQLALSAGAGLAQWAFRNAGGNLYFSTTTVAGTATTSTSALTILGSNGNIGIGTTSPWGGLSIANSSISNYSSPLFFVSTSTIPTGQLFGIFATTTTLRLGAGTSNTLYPDVGTRIGVGLSSYLGYGGLLDQLTINGRVNTQGWLSITCDTPGSVASTVIGNICNGWSYGETEPVSGSSLTTGVGSGYMFYRSSGMQTSGNGIGIYAGATGATNWITLATSTPVMEVTFRFGNTVGNSMSTTTNVMIGFTSVPQNSVDVTNAPTNGCYLTASSTQQNWRAISRSASTETNVDTGIASTTLTSKGLAGFRKFRIEADSSHCAFYIQSTESSSLVKVANITTNIPTVVLSAGVQAGNRGVASSLTPVADMFRLRFWWRDTVPAL